MLRALLGWFGFSRPHDSDHEPHGSHAASGAAGHGHTHGLVDAKLASSERGIWALKWSFAILGVTALLQVAVVLVSDSVALLADTIHNLGDAATAVPLWFAFVLARRKPSRRFTYGLGRAEDLAGAVIVLIILASAIVAGYTAIERLLNPRPIAMLGWVAAAAVIGFVGNEAVAVFRIRVGRQMNSAALIADGYHARTDGLTSLAVLAGAIGVWLGFPLADPIVGLLITVAILAIVWQSAKAVFTRMLDGVEPTLTDDIRHAAGHVAGVRQTLNVQARWSGHRLGAEVEVAIDGASTLREVELITEQVRRELVEHIPALAVVSVRARPDEISSGVKATREATVASTVA